MFQWLLTVPVLLLAFFPPIVYSNTKVTPSLESNQILDKIVAVIGDEIITLSMIKRIRENLPARHNISPLIYQNTNLTDPQLIELVIRKKMVHSHLAQLGHVITDEQVESQIKDTERRLRLTRKDLLNFLDSNNMSFQEYFELIRDTIEYVNIFIPRVIYLMVSVTEQEIKNTFYRLHSQDETLAFRYTLVSFSWPKSKIEKLNKRQLTEGFKNFQDTGNFPNELKGGKTDVLEDIQDDSIGNNIKQALKKIGEGEFSEPVVIADQIHVFFVKKKDLVESSLFQKEKAKIKQDL